MLIAIIVEGETEKTFKQHLVNFLKNHLQGNMPTLDFVPCDGRVPKGDKLKSLVRHLLAKGKKSADHVIALTDVYTGTTPRDFDNAADAKAKMSQWVGKEPRFHPHVALHDFEAWLIPYWDTIQRLAGHNTTAPAGAPECVNHMKPPAAHIQEIFRKGDRGKRYVKPRDGGRILRQNGLTKAVGECPELKALVNTILTLCGAPPISTASQPTSKHPKKGVRMIEMKTTS